jgi:phage shock protein PspC (stress-responsive transcriptional regulator)
VVRVLYVVLAVFPLVPGLLVYVILWLALPESEPGLAERTQ